MKVTRSKPARGHIDLSDEASLRRWAKKLGTTQEEIAAAVAKVGTNAETVKKELLVERSDGHQA